MSTPGAYVSTEQPFINWPAIIAGAVLAAGVSFTLLAFGSGIGLSIASTAPTWRESSPWLWLLSGLFLLFVALCAFGVGGYAVGRMRARLAVAATPEAGFRDGMHGLFMWGLSIVLTAVLSLASAGVVTRAVPAGASIPSSSAAGETIIASELDSLFRTDRRFADADIEYRRAEAARILLKSSSHRGVSEEDRDYLAALAGRVAGTGPDEAQARAIRAISDSRDEIRATREAAVLQAFMIAAALFIGAAVSWYAAFEGGLDREEGVIPVWDWSFRRRRAPDMNSRRNNSPF